MSWTLDLLERVLLGQGLMLYVVGQWMLMRGELLWLCVLETGHIKAFLSSCYHAPSHLSVVCLCTGECCSV